ncbi:hypothetical protein [Paenibacillus pabuli]|uniref:hypothetical protein n=1 Tax=Paenibacillus pabuli TaxID=1472 RepID=UPI000783FBC9|nr:hypothetical protein [Paenibacillus pabuli]MEC0127523.1 hypothetical protein [Paenibacillus pabuli]
MDGFSIINPFFGNIESAIFFEAALVLSGRLTKADTERFMVDILAPEMNEISLKEFSQKGYKYAKVSS